MTRIRRNLTAFIATLAIASFAAPALRAQDAAKDTVKHWAFTGNLGLAIVSGNTSLTTITAGDELVWTDGGKWKVKQVFGLIYGKNDSVETANQVFFGLRGDYALSNRWGLYAGARFDRNPFAGFGQRYNENLGVVWNAVVAPKDKLDIEAGLGLTQQNNTDGTTQNFPNGRGAFVYRHSWKEKTYFQEAFEVLPDLKTPQNLRMNSLAELVAPISTHLGLRLSYLVQYDKQPQPGFKTTDQTLSAGVQLSY